jgi:hypothetical protein
MIEKKSFSGGPIRFLMTTTKIMIFGVNCNFHTENETLSPYCHPRGVLGSPILYTFRLDMKSKIN